MTSTAKISKNDALRLRVIEVKTVLKKVRNYTILYEYEFGKLTKKQLEKVRAVYNLREVDESVTKNLETIAKQIQGQD